MRYFSILLALTACGALSAAETWRWVDKDGLVHYADQPVPGAEKLELLSAPKPGSVASPASAPRAASAPTGFVYTSCAVITPRQDEVFNNVNSVGAAIEILPSLRPDDRVRITLNGSPVRGWPAGARSFLLTELFRGSYTLDAQVLDPSGKAMCSSPSLTFHIRQPSLLSPARPKPGRS